MHSKSIRWSIAGLVLLLLISLMVWYKLFREVDQEPFATPEEAFKYGSIGNEANNGIPYWIWRVLPQMFPEYLPGSGGYTALGLFWEPGKETPVGFSIKTVGVPRVAFNCAFCHQTSYRLKESDLPTLIPEGTGNRVDPQAYIRFLAAAGADARFNSDAILAEIKSIYDLSWLDRQLYRYVLIPAAKKALIRQGQNSAWTTTRTDWGRGRIDPFNPIKFGILKMGLDDTIGNSDMMPLWNMAAKTGKTASGEIKALHWDGLNTSLHEVVVTGAIGDGMTYKTYPATKHYLDRMEQWLGQVPSPPSPFSSNQTPTSPYYVAADQVAAGQAIYARECSICHAVNGARNRTVIPVEEVGTDRHRVDMWTAEAAKRYGAYQKEHDWGFKGFQNVDGYVAVTHDGLWLRAPYLHNGSVPTLRDMLKKPADRPVLFYRGYDLIDPVNGGFIAQGEKAERVSSRYDTRLPGNSNQGHLYGTDLSESDKEALLAYLKTL
ncbi:MAG: cytochrome c [Candidatus Competibacteraceae bacterium]